RGNVSIRCALRRTLTHARLAPADAATITNLLRHDLFSHRSLLSILRFHRFFFCVICGWIRLPKLDLILQLDPLLASHAFANLFRERKRIFGARILTFSDDEVR